MILTAEQTASLLEASKPLIKWLNDNCHPHCAALVENDRATLVEGVASVKTEEFVKD